MYGPDEVYTETKLNSAYSFGGPKCLVKVIQKLSGLSINRFMAVDFAGFSKMVDALGGVEVCSTTPLEDYELGTVLPNAGRQMVDGHTALQLRARAAGHHRDQRRLRPHQAPAAVPVLAAALADLQGDVLLAEQAQQRGQHVHQRQLRRQHRHQGPGRPRPVAAGRQRRSHHLRDRADRRLRRRVRQRGTPRRTTCERCSTRSSTTTRCPRRRTPTTHRFPARRSRDQRNHRVADQRDADTRVGSRSGEVVDAVTTDPGIGHRAGVQLDRSRTGWRSTAATELQQHGFNVDDPRRLSRPAGLDDGVLLGRQRGGRGDRGVGVRRTPTIERGHGMGDVVQVVLGSDFSSVSAPTPSGSSVQVHVLHGTQQRVPRTCPRT